MKHDSVPQDQSPTYGGRRKLLYAIDERGCYTGVQSSGWEAESQATLMAIDDLNAQRDDALQRARRGETSSLEYHMFERRMDLLTLAQTTGMARWRVKRHLKPATFAKLPEKILSRYSDALGLPIATLRTLPDEATA
jgi:hypothetical protein